MASTEASSSAPPANGKPVIVRIKRKAFQSRLDAFWLEINERPFKRPLIDFEKLSISDSSTKVEELKSRKLFVQHVETVTTSEVTADIVQNFVFNSAGDSESQAKNDTRRHFKTENKQEQLLSKAKQQQEILSKNARFKQIWRSRKEKKEHARDEELNEMCYLYDVVRIEEEKNNDLDVDQVSEVEDCKMMSEYLPLLREVLPSAAAEVEADIYNTVSKRALPDHYVYDYYAVREDMNITEENALSPFPLVQVEDEEFYAGPDDSGSESYDSNAEDNPLNDYPDGDSSDMEDDNGSRYSEDKLEAESRSSGHDSEEGENTSEKSSGNEMLGSETSDDNVDYDDWAPYDDDDDDEEWSLFDL